MKQRLPRKQKKQTRLVSKWLAAHPEYRPREPHINRLNIETHYAEPIKYQTFVRERAEFFERCPDAMERIKYELAEGFVGVIMQHMEVQEVTDNYDLMQDKRRFVAVLSLFNDERS